MYSGTSTSVCTVVPLILLFTDTEEEVWTQWCAYISGPIAECNLRNEMMLGGERTLTSSFDDSEEDFDPHKLGPGHILEKVCLSVHWKEYTQCYKCSTASAYVA